VTGGPSRPPQAPLRSKDDFRVTSRVDRMTPARIVFEHEIWALAGPHRPEAVRCVHATATICCLDADYRATRVPAALAGAIRGVKGALDEAAAAAGALN